ncbi:MAG: phenylalanine--tRNA ligase subunit alpha [Firmicutes bacterium]|nr:phenylalanine--tRNA ligase subunit alpha [Bacillota bacterium]
MIHIEKVKELMSELNGLFEEIRNKNELETLKAEYMGKNGKITLLNQMIKEIPNEDKKEFGMQVNELKNKFNSEFAKVAQELEEAEINEKLNSEAIDVSLPGTKIEVGNAHPIERIIESLEALLMSMGYDVIEGPEVEKDLYNFELLNLPKGHPARDAQDTFYIKGEEYLLRSQTSPVQARCMLAHEGKDPIRIICPGKTYRRDEDDATHSHQFTQMEGLLIDTGITLGDLKGTFEEIAKMLFGKSRSTRFRPSFYPFTEPSVEMDISCFNCNGKGCNICKGTGWITVGGAGMVNPIVLRNCGYDPNKWNGFAFGFGIERLAMLKYGINDVRTFYINHDIKTLKQFDRREY